MQDADFSDIPATKTSITDSSSSITEANVIVSELTDEAKLKMEVIQSLLEAGDRKTYAQKLQQAAVKLGKSVRTVRRLIDKWEQEGLAGLTQPQRADKGKHRVNENWQEFILKTYKEGNKGSKRMTRQQVAVRVRARADELGVKPPSHMTVYRILQPLIEKQEKAKSVRSPGWRGSRLAMKTRDGKDLSVDYSNHVWQCDHTRVDALLVDQHGKILGRPWLTTVVDSYSRCIIGINLGYDAPSSQVVALALRHAILPKQYGSEYGLHQEWGTYGLPEHFYTDGGKDFRSNHLQQIAVQLGFVCHLRVSEAAPKELRPSEGGIVERPFKTFNTELFSNLPGYTGSNVQERPEEAEKEACLTLRQLEQQLVRYIVNHYNQRIDARMGEQTRFQRWESGLIAVPDAISERDLDICLMKQTRRQIQRGGYLQFENIMYRGELLAGYAGESIILRFDPRDITTILVYRQQGNREEFVARAFAQDLETEQLSLDEAKASSRKIREAGKTISNRSILAEFRERETFVNQKPTKKERQKAEQMELKKAKQPSLVEVEQLEIASPQSQEELEMPEVFDYEQMREDYGF
ncbi:Mu transposase C-terminal domain-containing protein [Anabaena subtropica]|uniref:Mu transposase C-terminal domain-containing protein n=1 Tax=Anabaena subtropica FACHB-260 TaxID=2692884 RepID=A0ABR8CUM7_9NOST|nr:Mu transposase C-terminal domain-containing protein [Anabaena subtropica]MBD2346481.1 Mu transposase C-terminal domain-containing protein [Anabaena subtropica FACHB-260]